MFRIIIFLLMFSVSSGTANASNLLGLSDPPKYTPPKFVPLYIPFFICNAASCTISWQPRVSPWLCQYCDSYGATMTCLSYIYCHALPSPKGLGFLVTDIFELPGTRIFYEKQRKDQMNEAKKQLTYFSKQKGEQYYLLSGIRNAIGQPDQDAKIAAITQSNADNIQTITDIGALSCGSLADLMIKEDPKLKGKEAEIISECARKSLAAMINLNNDNRDNTSYAYYKKAFQNTCQEAALTHAAYSMTALDALYDIHAHMRTVSQNLAAILYKPCVDDLSIFEGKNYMALVEGLAGIAESFGVNFAGFDAAFSLRLKELEMPVQGCVIRSMEMLQQLEADRILIEHYKSHLQKLKTTNDALNNICNNPTYFSLRPAY